MTGRIVYSVVLPVYKNAASIPSLLDRLDALAAALDGAMEAVFVVDGSPDASLDVLSASTHGLSFTSQIVRHSRNFGSFAAIRTGLGLARGDYIAVMAADLQEPVELVHEFFRLLSTDLADVTVGRRESRSDPLLSRLGSSAFWGLYRRTVFPQMPKGGVDIFACTRAVAQELCTLSEAHSSLVGLLYWVGYRRLEVPYTRMRREHGKSAWSFQKKLRYLLDSVFSFTDLPLTLLTGVGVVGGITTAMAAIVVVVSFALGAISEPGYTPLMLVILMSTFALLAALGIVGSYVWRAYENTKQRPTAIVMSTLTRAAHANAAVFSTPSLTIDELVPRDRVTA